MSVANNQVLTALQLGMTPEEIAEDLGYDLMAVKTAIGKLVDSGIFKGAVSQEVVLANGQTGVEVAPQGIFSDEDEELAKNTIRELATCCEVDSVRLKAAERIIDERKGRLDVAKTLAQDNFNIALVNTALARARLNMEKTRQKAREEKQLKEGAVNV